MSSPRNAPLITGLQPIADKRARVLILGSMPGVRSLELQEYYAHPRNRFWELMGRILGVGELEVLSYSRRVRVVQEHRIALWDVARECRRVGSSDASMTHVEANDIARLLRSSRHIGAIYCNGRRSRTLFERLVQPALAAPIPVGYLPSTSPANAAWTMPRLLAEWRCIGALPDGTDDTTRVRRDGSKIRPGM